MKEPLNKLFNEYVFKIFSMIPAIALRLVLYLPSILLDISITLDIVCTRDS